MKSKFKNANEAYEAVLDEILQEGIDFGDTKAIFNCGFYNSIYNIRIVFSILNPYHNDLDPCVFYRCWL